MAASDDRDSGDIIHRVEFLEYIIEAILADERRLWSSPNLFKRGRSIDRDEIAYRARRLFDERHYYFERFDDRLDELGREQGRIRELVESARKDQVYELKDPVYELAVGLDQADARHAALSAELHHWLSIQSLGLDTAEAKLRRIVPLRVYLSEVPKEGTSAIVAAVDELMAAFGFEVTDEFPEILGSWYKKWFARTKEFASQPEVEQRLQKIERAVELRGLGVPQAEIDEKQANAIATLITSLGTTGSAAIQSGSILLLKLSVNGKSAIQAKTLTQREIMLLENNQGLLDSPESVLGKLASLCAKDLKKSAGEALEEATEGWPKHSDGYEAKGLVTRTAIVPHIDPPKRLRRPKLKDD